MLPHDMKRKVLGGMLALAVGGLALAALAQPAAASGHLACTPWIIVPDNPYQEAQAISCLWWDRGVCWEVYTQGWSNGEQRGCILRGVLPDVDHHVLP